jgi:hypothetical protein
MLTLKVEGMIGSSPEECTAQALELADRIKVCVSMDYNGVLLFAMPGEAQENILTRFNLFTRIQK